jgi:hypothetical protein
VAEMRRAKPDTSSEQIGTSPGVLSPLRTFLDLSNLEPSIWNQVFGTKYLEPSIGPGHELRNHEGSIGSGCCRERSPPTAAADLTRLATAGARS